MNWMILFSRRWFLTTVLVVVAAAVCARLGVWQLDRLKQRRAFNAHIYAVQAMKPLQLPADSSAEDLDGMEYRGAAATGTYDFARQVVIRNQYYSSEVGYHLVTPLVMKNGEALLVDRGWIPADGNTTPAAWHKYDVPGQLTVTGVIRASQTETIAFGPSDPTPMPGQKGLDQWIYLNVDRIASAESAHWSRSGYFAITRRAMSNCSSCTRAYPESLISPGM